MVEDASERGVMQEAARSRYGSWMSAEHLLTSSCGVERARARRVLVLELDGVDLNRGGGHGRRSATWTWGRRRPLA